MSCVPLWRKQWTIYSCIVLIVGWYWSFPLYTYYKRIYKNNTLVHPEQRELREVSPTLVGYFELFLLQLFAKLFMERNNRISTTYQKLVPTHLQYCMYYKASQYSLNRKGLRLESSWEIPYETKSRPGCISY